MQQFLTTRTANIVLYFLFLGTILYLILSNLGALVVFIIGTVIAYVGYPLVSRMHIFLENRGLSYKISRSFSIVLFISLLVLMLAGFFWALGGLLYSQFLLIFRQLQDSREIIMQFLKSNNIDIPSYSGLQPMLDTVGISVNDVANIAISAVFSTVNVTFGIGIGIVLIPFWLFYIMYEPSKIGEGALLYFPKNARDDARHIGRITDKILAKYIRGLLFLSLIIFIAVTLGMSFIGMPNALALGLIAAILEFIPIFGSILAWVVALIIAIPLGIDMMISVSIVSLIIQQVEGNLLVPKVQGDTVEMPSWVVMLIVTIAGAVGGFIGMVIGLPLAAITYNVVYYLHLRLKPGSLTAEKAYKYISKQPMSFDEL